MLASKNLRWSGAAINNGRQRLSTNQGPARLYSLTTSRASLLNRCCARPQRLPGLRSSAEQVRSISLWGWASSKSHSAEFGEIHTPRSSSAPDAALGHDGQVLAQQASPSSRSIPAVHQTSDVPPLESLPFDQEPALSTTTSSPWEQPAGTPEELSSVDPLDPAEAFASIPERIGYLKQVCGLDFGIGPTSMMEMLLEHIHIYGCVSWTMSIVLLAIFTRMALFYPMAQSSDLSARWKATQAIIGPVRERISAAYKAQDYAKMAEAKAELGVLMSEYKIQPFKMFLPVVCQLPLQFGAFRLLRNMAELPVPALKTENWLWSQDLTLGDPFFILPVASAAMTYLTLKRGGETGTSQIQGGLLTSLTYILPFLSFVFMIYQPGTVQLYFVLTASSALLQSRLLTNASARRWLGLHAVVPTPKDPTPSGSAGAAGRLATTTHTQALGAGGLKLYQPARPTSPEPPALPATAKASNASLIDRFVDKAKARKAEALDGIFSLMGTSKEQRIKDAQLRKDEAVADRYERRMAQESEMRREERNRDKIARIESGIDGEFDPKASDKEDAAPRERERERERERGRRRTRD